MAEFLATSPAKEESAMRQPRRTATRLFVPALVGFLLLTIGPPQTWGQDTAAGPSLEPLSIESVRVQGLRRTVRFYRPEKLAERPALVLVLHGGGGDGGRFRLLTDGAFERLADEQGFLVAYPDALGGQWNGCRAGAPYHEALAGIDETAFLRAVVRRARDLCGRDLGGVFVVGYSNGGQLGLRLALEVPGDFGAFAVIGAHLPVLEQRDCHASGTPVSIFLVSGTNDPINPWRGGRVVAPGGESLGEVLSAEATAAYFHSLLGGADQPKIEQHADRDPGDGTRVETRRWVAEGREVVLMIVHGGGHALPHPNARFPAALVGRTSRDVDGARVIWDFFARQADENRSLESRSPDSGS
jgi:polyhydroxybutyrate depolymerase